MPVSIDATEDVVNVTASGTITYQEVAEIIAHRSTNGARRPNLPVLVDARAVDGAPSAKDLRRIVMDLRPLVGSGMGPIGIITDSVYVYGVVRMFSVFAQELSTTVLAFRCAEEAKEWLLGLRSAASNRLVGT